jgi:hypothetical protein
MCQGDPRGSDCPNLVSKDCSCCQCSNINQCDRTIHQLARPDLWPTWGYNGMGSQDLAMGYMGGGGPPGGRPEVVRGGAYCSEGATYASPPSAQWCGGIGWGDTDIEVWRRAESEKIVH